MLIDQYAPEDVFAHVLELDGQTDPVLPCVLSPGPRRDDAVVHLARHARVTSGRKLRIDATVVETAIHHPTDGSLLVDSVRVLSRVIRRIRPEAGGLARWHPTYLRATRRPPIYVPAAKSQHQIVLQ